MSICIHWTFLFKAVRGLTPCLANSDQQSQKEPKIANWKITISNGKINELKGHGFNGKRSDDLPKGTPISVPSLAAQLHNSSQPALPPAYPEDKGRNDHHEMALLNQSNVRTIDENRPIVVRFVFAFKRTIHQSLFQQDAVYLGPQRPKICQSSKVMELGVKKKNMLKGTWRV